MAGQQDCTPRLTDPTRQSSAMRGFFLPTSLEETEYFLIVIAQQLSNHFSTISKSSFVLTCTNEISDARGDV